MATNTRPATRINPGIDDALARAGARDRANIEKHLAACDADSNPSHGQLWRRLFGTLASLAPMPVQTIGQRAVRFFIPDGKYRMQVFALEDQLDGVILLYLPDVLAQAARGKLISGSGGRYAAARDHKQVLDVQPMDASNTANPASHVAHMIGWNRKAVKVTLPASEVDSAQVAAVESMCALAAEQWAAAPKP